MTEFSGLQRTLKKPKKRFAFSKMFRHNILCHSIKERALRNQKTQTKSKNRIDLKPDTCVPTPLVGLLAHREEVASFGGAYVPALL